jgi:hypothetical protein
MFLAEEPVTLASKLVENFCTPCKEPSKGLKLRPSEKFSGDNACAGTSVFRPLIPKFCNGIVGIILPLR